MCTSSLTIAIFVRFHACNAFCWLCCITTSSIKKFTASLLPECEIPCSAVLSCTIHKAWFACQVASTTVVLHKLASCSICTLPSFGTMQRPFHLYITNCGSLSSTELHDKVIDLYKKPELQPDVLQVILVCYEYVLSISNLRAARRSR
jgi:hypothetical protein